MERRCQRQSIWTLRKQGMRGCCGISCNMWSRLIQYSSNALLGPTAVFIKPGWAQSGCIFKSKKHCRNSWGWRRDSWGWVSQLSCGKLPPHAYHKICASLSILNLQVLSRSHRKACFGVAGCLDTGPCSWTEEIATFEAPGIWYSLVWDTARICMCSLWPLVTHGKRNESLAKHLILCRAINESLAQVAIPGKRTRIQDLWCFLRVSRTVLRSPYIWQLMIEI